MNPSETADSSPDAAAETRRQRAAIAAQACETCRSRKCKCDEQRPKCGLCRRLGVECNYRDPRPTKKDKTLDSILQALERAERKVERLLDVISRESNVPPGPQDEPIRPAPGAQAQGESEPSLWREHKVLKHRGHLAALHRVLLWPAVSDLLQAQRIEAASDLPDIEERGTGWFIQQELDKHPDVLPPHFRLYAVPVQRSRDGLPRVLFPSLTKDLMSQYADQYFNTYNVLYPILDYDDFMHQTLPMVAEHGFGDGCFKSLIALFVFALGKVAIEGVFGKAIANKEGDGIGIRGSLSGMRGGTADEPPALEIFNEAQRRLGFVLAHVCLENAQILLLRATYFESCSRHADFWRSTVMASEAIQVILKRSVNWESHEGDMIKRAYWICNTIEAWYIADLDLPGTGIAEYQNDVPLPLFVPKQQPGTNSGSGSSNDKLIHYQYNFLGMIAIRRLMDRIGDEIYDVSGDGSREGYAHVPVRIIKELDRQLNSWRSLLPEPLQWADDHRTQYTWYDPHTSLPTPMQFTVDRDGDQLSFMYNVDVIMAVLRSRFYYCRFMIYRPFLFKALHFPAQMSEEDVECCVIGLESCLTWPVCMWPVQNKKRLVPNIFVWTQSFLSILLVMRVAAEDTLLKGLLEERLDVTKVRDSLEMMLDWMRDMQLVSGIAEWSWRVLEPLYRPVL